MVTLQNERFLEAVERVVNEARCRDGIGRLGEKLVHASLKLYYEPNTACHERKAAGFVADILNDRGITEIQTGPFTPLKRKLCVFLKDYDVTVVHPVANRKTIIWIDAAGEFSSPVKSPKKRDIFGVFTKLVSILPYLDSERLTVILPLLDVEEYRLLHEKYGKRRSLRYETLPKAFCGEIVLKRAEDYARLLPDTLGANFTAKEFSKLCKARGRALSASLKVLLTLGVLGREKEGKGYRYFRLIQKENQE